ncbi:MAG: retropepsin-like aspartic protease [Candidatus Omnitrophota bacterium]|nr:retroviral-like aspartic protease family protein [Candidatus Omnitrophota bacterium]
MPESIKLRSKVSFKLIAVLLFFCVLPEAYADTLYLKNGRVIEGIIKYETGDSLKLDIGIGVVGFKKSQIEKISRSNPEEKEGLLKKMENEQQKQEKLRQESSDRIDALNTTELSQPGQVKAIREGNHLFVEAILDKKTKAKLMVDTGASAILLTRSMGEKLGVDLNKKNKKNLMKVQVADGREVECRYFKLDTVKIGPYEVGGVDSMVLFDNIKDSTFADGLLGMSYLKNFVFRIDQENGQLILQRRR